MATILIVSTHSDDLRQSIDQTKHTVITVEAPNKIIDAFTGNPGITAVIFDMDTAREGSFSSARQIRNIHPSLRIIFCSSMDTALPQQYKEKFTENLSSLRPFICTPEELSKTLEKSLWVN